MLLKIIENKLSTKKIMSTTKFCLLTDRAQYLKKIIVDSIFKGNMNFIEEKLTGYNDVGDRNLILATFLGCWFKSVSNYLSPTST